MILLVLMLMLQPTLTEQIRQLVHTSLVTEDGKKERAARAEAQRIFREHGLLTIAQVGDEASYGLVWLTCSPQVSVLAKQAALRHEVPADAAVWCEAHLRQEKVKGEADKQPPQNTTLRDRIMAIYGPDQAVRQKEGDVAAMLKTDAANKAELEAIFAQYGVPGYAMVGSEAASAFVVMVQHQAPEFRVKVLPKLKANVEAGQADPGSYAMVCDRAHNDVGGKQLYGENFTCDAANPKLHPWPIEDEAHVDDRRAQLGLMRLSFYAQGIVENGQAACKALAAAAGNR